jgi:hypothetical protein
MMYDLHNRYNLENRRRHGEIQEYPFIINLFPDLYQDATGKYVPGPFQMVLLPNEEKTIPFIFPRDSIYKTMYFRFDVTAPIGNGDIGFQYISARLTDISINLVHKSGGDRTAFPHEQLGVFEGTNNGFAQVRIPYIHPKEGSIQMAFKNLRNDERRVSGWFYGMKVAS